MNKFLGAGLDEVDYGSVDVAENIFNGANTLQKMMDVEAALSTVQAELGIIPEKYAIEINKKNDVNLLDESYYKEQRQLTGHPLVGLIRAYKNICDDEAGEYIHFGATTQDITDTAMMLQIKEANTVIVNKIKKLINILEKLTIENKNRVVMGRTNDQHALPITLGFKFATWLDEINRSLTRILDSEDRIFVGQFSGAVGTMASVGEVGLEVQELLLKELGLGVPQISWFATRDRLVELVSNYAILTGSLGRIGNEVYNEQRTEVNELSESYGSEAVGSSTMPHKKNPFTSGALASYGRLSRTVVTDILQTMESTNERDVRGLNMEVYHIKKICFLADSALDTSIKLLDTIVINQKGIEQNLNLLDGLVFSEALMMRLSESIGRLSAHDLIHEIAMESIENDKSFKESLYENPEILKIVTKEEIDEIMRPEKYIGLSSYFAEKVVNSINID